MHFSNENVSTLINISLEFIPNGQIKTILALVQIIAWRLPGDKPLSEPMMVIVYWRIYTSLCPNELMMFCEWNPMEAYRWHGVRKLAPTNSHIRKTYNFYRTLIRVMKDLLTGPYHLLTAPGHRVTFKTAA